MPYPERPDTTVASRPSAGFQSRVPQGLEPVLFELWRTFPGRTGISVRRIDGGNWHIGYRAGDYMPQQSVSKLWVTLAVLHRVEAGKLNLDDGVRITPDDLTLFSQPIAARVLREKEIVEPVRSLIAQAINRSDNTANDSLLRAVGGPDTVRAMLQSHGLTGIRFGPGERLLQSRIAGMTWDQSLSVGRAFYAARDKVPMERRKAAMAAYLADPIDGATPEGITYALAKLARGELLGRERTHYLMNTLERTITGPNRLKGGIPAGWKIGHKTGTGQQLNGVSTGYNDIGIVTAPDGTRYAIAVMLGDTTAPIVQRLSLMQQVTRAVVHAHNGTLDQMSVVTPQTPMSSTSDDGE